MNSDEGAFAYPGFGNNIAVATASLAKTMKAVQDHRQEAERLRAVINTYDPELVRNMDVMFERMIAVEKKEEPDRRLRIPLDRELAMPSPHMLMTEVLMEVCHKYVLARMKQINIGCDAVLKADVVTKPSFYGAMDYTGDGAIEKDVIHKTVRGASMIGEHADEL